jgi:intein-encoded DNA endonuclease-like protein
MALLMEEITSQYAARGTSISGVVFVGVQKQTLSEMADKFQSDYLALAEMAKDKRSQVILDSIGSKWAFMERSIRNYNENSVPFLVVSYNDRIVGHLQELDDLYH